MGLQMRTLLSKEEELRKNLKIESERKRTARKYNIDNGQAYIDSTGEVVADVENLNDEEILDLLKGNVE